MVFGRLNLFGYFVVSSVLLTFGALLFGRLDYAALFFGIAVLAQWVALRKNETDSDTHDTVPDESESDERRKQREREMEGDKGRAGGLG